MAAESSEVFNIGSSVSCMTCFDEELQGEVLAFDPHVKLLTLSILFWLNICGNMMVVVPLGVYLLLHTHTFQPLSHVLVVFVFYLLARRMNLCVCVHIYCVVCLHSFCIV